MRRIRLLIATPQGHHEATGWFAILALLLLAVDFALTGLGIAATAFGGPPFTFCGGAVQVL